MKELHCAECRKTFSPTQGHNPRRFCSDNCQLRNWRKRQRVKKAHVGHATGNNEWYTPAPLIEAARRVMGKIDLDPASSAVANEIVRATKFYTEEDDGLAQPWEGRVWMNPPYAQPFITQFCHRVAWFYERGEVTEAIVLINNASETAYFQALMAFTGAICFPRSRVRFWHPDKKSAPLQGQAIIYLGSQHEKFCEEFAEFGRCR